MIIPLLLVFLTSLSACKPDEILSNLNICLQFDGKSVENQALGGGCLPLKSSAFKNGEKIPLIHGCSTRINSEGLSGSNTPIPLDWSGGAELKNHTKYAVFMEDKVWKSVEMKVYNIPLNVTSSDFSTEYTPPCLGGRHDYDFTIFALSGTFSIDDDEENTSAEFAEKYKSNIIATNTLKGYFEWPEGPAP